MTGGSVPLSRRPSLVGDEPFIIHPQRETILPKRGEQQPGIPWQSWVLLFASLGAGFALFWFTHGLVIEPWLRWSATAVWVALTLALGLLDFVAHAKLPGSLDTVPVDRWTISHGLAGLIFGIWYLPLWVMLLLVILWEVFEMKVVGFGEKEDMANRAVDVLIAVVGWLVVVLVAMGTGSSDPSFPLLVAR